ncbi:MAG: hypothetical protein JWQ81_4939 [Amycolatopsis sp.]|jgi:cell division septum initiation protein DivIVA|uniref:M protein n=1 Tax=Amycolatopsis sp. TaxID=37632 RepID=UPI00261CC660|nr:M protein [Amycolatopsis sp.]MCU1684200.1 hypothetical protein [Amycolatopsis sp.]
MTTSESHPESVSLRTDFELSWRGFARKEVRSYLATVEEEMGALTADLEATAAHARMLARRVEELLEENGELHTKIDCISRVPIEPDALQARSRRMIELTREEAVEIRAEAQAAADRLREQAEEAVAHAERRRRQADSDFDDAMAVRRAEAMAAIAQREAAARAQAEALLLKAAEQGERVVAEAKQRANAANELRARFTAQLENCQQVLDQALPLLDPVPGETGLDLPTQRAVRLSVQDTVPIKPLTSSRSPRT